MDELKPQIAPTEFEEFRSVLRENELGSAMNVFDDRKGTEKPSPAAAETVHQPWYSKAVAVREVKIEPTTHPSSPDITEPTSTDKNPPSNLSHDYLTTPFHTAKLIFRNWNFFQQKYMKTSSIQKPSTSSSASLGTSQENTTSTASTALLSQESFGTKSAATSSGNSEQKINTFDKSKNNNESTSTASSYNHSFYQNKLKKAAMALRLASLGSSQVNSVNISTIT
ncbi:hypothetical protein HHI36_005858 [Cryptolaemus montrouzieri]|uniref:Uncharacterized protein n=1 Tax=Cryptolaemus montrouzieri TaxID=559131 RepID=A0ABD2NW85_9CUCU